jgi:hypothetical protein
MSVQDAERQKHSILAKYAGIPSPLRGSGKDAREFPLFEKKGQELWSQNRFPASFSV